MGKQSWKPGNMLYPVPAVLITVADRKGNPNIFTVAWTGTICSDPPMVSISVRPERYSHQMIEETEEFVVNLTTRELTFATDYCGEDNESCSTRGVMRGLHFQRPPYAQAKLVRCVRGAVVDVAVDLRKGSPTYGRHVAVELTEENHRQFFIPRGFAHGFAVLSDVAVFQYKCDNYYHPEADGGISIVDPSLGIDWRMAIGEAILSDKDKRHPRLEEFETPFTF